MGKKVNMGVPKVATEKNKVAAGPLATPSDQPASPRPLDDWDHQNNAESLLKAQEIMGDPEKMKGAMIHLRKKAKAMRSVKDLQEFHQAKYGANGDPTLGED